MHLFTPPTPPAPPAPPLTPSAPIALTSRSMALRLRGGTDRRITLAAISIAALYVALTVASVVTQTAATLGAWLPLHLLLAGAASTAIAGVMPFFSAAVSNAPPAATPVRLVGVLGVAAGAAVLVIGRGFWPVGTPWSGSFVAGLGGLVYLTGVLGVGVATLWPLRKALGARRFFMGAVYGAALLNVFAGVSLATLFLLGWEPVLAAWATLKPTHAWLNLFGFVSLAMAGSLLHLLPTVAGSRIRRTTASLVCFVALALGPILVALGFVFEIKPLALLGAAMGVVGALALAWHAITVLRARAPWSTDPSWHLFTTWSLVAGIGWFGLATLIAAAQVLIGGASGAGWSLAPLAVPMGIGWAAQVLVAAWSHLVPAVGPGTLEQHARQRFILGRAGPARLAVLNIGAAAMAVGRAFADSGLEAAGLVLVLLAGLAAVVLLAAALAVLFRFSRGSLGRF